MTPPVNRNSALFLDIDGTLLDMARTPDDVVVPDGLLASLARLHDALDGALAFVSGRSLGAIDTLFAPFRTAAVGCHGAEIRSADGRVEALAAPIPDPVRALFGTLTDRHPGTLLEDKLYALSLHYRLAPEARSALLAAMEENAALFADQRVSIQLGKAVIDAKRVGIDKGVGVRTLMRQKPFRDRVPLFGGDDTTDTDVFHILPELGGEGFSVGRALRGAAYEFSSPEAVRQWLNDLAEEGVTA
ncbi:MAG: trehalose-phosphatase [Alphaproteobacteria bacterium]|nr:trehalose-phosphatase [Alphaproteobacteria bacterium]